MSGIALSATVDVDRPPDDVRRSGTTTAEELRMAGSSRHDTGLVMEVEPGRRSTWRTTSGVGASGSRAVVPLPGGRSRVELRVSVTPPASSACCGRCSR